MEDAQVDEPPDLSEAALMDPLDDLFGEAGDGLGVVMPPLPSEPLPPALTLRIAEMQRNGCST